MAVRFTRAWFVEHTDHFIIAIATSIPVSFVTNVVMHHMGQILRFAHVPSKLIIWFGF